MISGEKLKLLVREKVNRFLHFAHNKETGQFFGKTCKGWGVLLVTIVIITFCDCKGVHV